MTHFHRRQPETLGKPSCPHCKGYGYVNVAPEIRNGREFPRVVPCECRGGAPVVPPPIVTQDMKLDAQSRAAGETD